MKKILLAAVVFLCMTMNAHAISDAFKENIYSTGKLKPVDSVLKVKVGQKAPDFTLKAVSGKTVSLKDYRGKKNVVLSFVPAAWTPVCSDQWPGYNIVQELFEENNATLLGISVDNLPTLYSWTRQMGDLWFEVLSDFWPHGKLASRYGILRSDGTAERAIVIIDQKGIIRYVNVGDINERPPLEQIIQQLELIR